jgi:hypothetical protein
MTEQGSYWHKNLTYNLSYSHNIVVNKFRHARGLVLERVKHPPTITQLSPDSFTSYMFDF